MELSWNGFPGWRVRSLDSVSGHEQPGKEVSQTAKKSAAEMFVVILYGSTLMNAINCINWTKNVDG